MLNYCTPPPSYPKQATYRGSRFSLCSQHLIWGRWESRGSKARIQEGFVLGVYFSGILSSPLKKNPGGEGRVPGDWGTEQRALAHSCSPPGLSLCYLRCCLSRQVWPWVRPGASLARDKCTCIYFYFYEPPMRRFLLSVKTSPVPFSTSVPPELRGARMGSSQPVDPCGLNYLITCH